MLMHCIRKNGQEKIPKYQSREGWKGGLQSDKRECTVECCCLLEDILERAYLAMQGELVVQGWGKGAALM